MKLQDLTHSKLVELLDYNPYTGSFKWKTTRGPKAVIGSVAGSYHNSGCWEIHISPYGRYRAHRLAWLYVNGQHPKFEIDHINGDPLDNRISNLRDVTRTENQQNIREPRKHNKLGVLGVCSSGSRFRATIKINGKNKQIGVYDTVEQAYKAYVEAKRKFHNFSTL